MTMCAPIMPYPVLASAEPVTIEAASTWRAIGEVFRALLLRWWLMLLMEGRTADSTGRRNASKMEADDGYQEAAFGPMHTVTVAVSGTTASRQSGRA